eukprot:1965317-Pyramimonas_sp.AAC.1
MRLHHPLSECSATCGCTTLPDQPLSEYTYICITVSGARAPTDISPSPATALRGPIRGLHQRHQWLRACGPRRPIQRFVAP